MDEDKVIGVTYDESPQEDVSGYIHVDPLTGESVAVGELVDGKRKVIGRDAAYNYNEATHSLPSKLDRQRLKELWGMDLRDPETYKRFNRYYRNEDGSINWHRFNFNPYIADRFVSMRNPEGMAKIRNAVKGGGDIAGAFGAAVLAAPLVLEAAPLPALNRLGQSAVGQTAKVMFDPYTIPGAITNSALTAPFAVDMMNNGVNTENAIGVGLGALPYAGPAIVRGYNIGKNLFFDNLPFFVKTPNSYTRGLGMGNEGISDLVQTGIVRGNPRGTEGTANGFAKLFRYNKNHFRDIIEDTGIKGIESKYFSRTLNESEFNAIKEAAKKYKPNSSEVGTIRLKRNMDPLSNYSTYDEYINSINKQIEEANLMPRRVSSGEVEVDPVLIQGESGYLEGRPIKERFGFNSDYIGDGTPLTYWYSDGINAFRKGYDYAGSNWMIKVDNADKHQPFMHELHLHPSFFKAIKLNDPDVTVYRRLPFGIGLKIPKSWLYTRFSK